MTTKYVHTCNICEDDVEWKWFYTTRYECMRRAKAGGREDLLPIIEHMATDWEE